MTCTDCGDDVPAANVPAGMTTCVDCRLWQIERMDYVRESLATPPVRLVQVRHPFNAFEVMRSMHTGSLRETGRDE